MAWADLDDAHSAARIDLKPLNGQAVVLTYFDLGSYPGGTRVTTVTISACWAAGWRCWAYPPPPQIVMMELPQVRESR